MTNMELFIVIISIVSPIAVGLFVRNGVKAQIKANESNISKQVREELEKEKKLLIEKIKIEREDRFWNLKFDLFVNIGKSYSDATKLLHNIDVDNLKSIVYNLDELIIRVVPLFKDRSVVLKLRDAQSLFNTTIDSVIKPDNLKNIGALFRDSIEAAKTELSLD